MRTPETPSLPARAVTALVRQTLHLLYNQFAWTYDLVSWTVSLGHWKEWIRSALPLLEEAGRAGRILELGHGPGHLQQEMLWRGWPASGLDMSTSMGRIAHRQLRRAGFPGSLVRGRAQGLPFPGESFRAVVATFPSEYIADPRSLQEVNRVLCPGGRLIILPYAWITGRSWPERAVAWLFRFSQEAPETENPTFQGWVKEMFQFMSECGFQVSRREVELGSSRVMIISGEKV